MKSKYIKIKVDINELYRKIIDDTNMIQQKEDEKKLYRKIIDDTDMMQQKMAEYNEKNNLPIIRKDSRTIAEEENIIINKYGGKKLNIEYFYEHLSDFFGVRNSLDYLRMASPCKIIFNYTEDLIPEEYFYSFYLIPIGEEQKRKEDFIKDFAKEVLVYITSRDGINVYISGFINEYILLSREFTNELRSAINYCAEGIAVNFEDIENEK